MGYKYVDIQTRKDFYISYTAPVSMVQGDSIVLNINIINNLNISVETPVSMFVDNNTFSYLMLLFLPIAQPNSNVVFNITLTALAFRAD